MTGRQRSQMPVVMHEMHHVFWYLVALALSLIDRNGNLGYSLIVGHLLNNFVPKPKPLNRNSYVMHFTSIVVEE